MRFRHKSTGQKKKRNPVSNKTLNIFLWKNMTANNWLLTSPAETAQHGHATGVLFDHLTNVKSNSFISVPVGPTSTSSLWLLAVVCWVLVRTEGTGPQLNSRDLKNAGYHTELQTGMLIPSETSSTKDFFFHHRETFASIKI